MSIAGAPPTGESEIDDERILHALFPRAAPHVRAGASRPGRARVPGLRRRPIRRRTSRFQVGFAAGGIADVVARLVGQKLTERLGHTVVVENRGGAGGNLAAKSVSGAAPDGYTILATTTGLAVNETATKNKGFSVDDLRPVAIVAFSPDVLAIHPSNPAKDLREFIQNGKTKGFTYGSAGVGTGPHIGAEYFFREVAKVQAVHVPFTGGGPAVTSAIGNHVDAIVLTLPTVVPPITQGLLRGIGLASATRNSAVPNVPTYGEMGFPDVYSGSWVGFFAPAKTPDAVVCEAQRRDQRDHEGAGGAAEAQGHRFRRDDQDRGGGRRLLQA